MRFNLFKKKSTKTERIIYDTLRRLHIPFKYRWLIQGREIDFLIRNKYALEIDGHLKTDAEKNKMLVDEGYIPIHLKNQEIYKFRNKLKKFLKKLK